MSFVPEAGPATPYETRLRHVLTMIGAAAGERLENRSSIFRSLCGHAPDLLCS